MGRYSALRAYGALAAATVALLTSGSAGTIPTAAAGDAAQSIAAAPTPYADFQSTTCTGGACYLYFKHTPAKKNTHLTRVSCLMQTPAGTSLDRFGMRLNDPNGIYGSYLLPEVIGSDKNFTVYQVNDLIDVLAVGNLVPLVYAFTASTPSSNPSLQCFLSGTTTDP
jgi:hypothetical protein